MASDVVQDADIGMIQRRHRPGLVLEALPDIVTFGNVIRQDFDSNGAVKPRIPGLVYLAHPARPDGGEDFVGSELVAGSQRHRFGVGQAVFQPTMLIGFPAFSP